MSGILQTFDSWSATWAAGLWRASLEGGAAIVVVWLVAHFCRVLSPRIICWMWRLVCAKLLVSLISIQPISIALLPADTPAEKHVAPISQTDLGQEGQRTTDFAAGTDFARALRAEPSMVLPEAPRRHIETRTVFAGVWLVGFIGCVLMTARQWLVVRRLRKTAIPASDDSLTQMLGQEADRLRIRRRPRIGRSPRLESPLLAGIWRPTIVLPQDEGRRFDDADLRLMIAHELAHQKRRDLAWNWLLRDKDGQSVASVGFPFSGVVPKTEWMKLPVDATIRLRASPFGIRREKAMGIAPDLSKLWVIADDDPNEYSLSGTFTIATADEGLEKDGGHIWRGTLELPAVRIRNKDCEAPNSEMGLRDSS